MSVRGRLLLAMSWLACRLPEGLVFRFAELAGDLWYRLAPDRAAQARRNLRRVCQSLAASGKGSPRVRAAATDPKALERLVRSAFRHSARYYLEVARMPGVTPAYVDERLKLETPELIAEAVVPGQGRPLRRAPFRIAWSWRSLPGVPGRGRPSRPWRPSTIRACRPISSGRAAWPASGWSA